MAVVTLIGDTLLLVASALLARMASPLRLVSACFFDDFKRHIDSLSSLSLDVIKTRMQTFPEKYTKGIFHTARDIVSTEGISFLLAGLGPTVVGYGFEGALKFGCYETFKKLFAHLTPNKMINFLLASVVAGVVASIVLVGLFFLSFSLSLSLYFICSLSLLHRFQWKRLE